MGKGRQELRGEGEREEEGGRGEGEGEREKWKEGGEGRREEREREKRHREEKEIGLCRERGIKNRLHVMVKHVISFSLFTDSLFSTVHYYLQLFGRLKLMTVFTFSISRSLAIRNVANRTLSLFELVKGF